MLMVLTGVGRAVGRHPVDWDEGAVEYHERVPGGRGGAASMATDSVTYLQAVEVPIPNPAVSSAGLSALRRVDQWCSSRLAGQSRRRALRPGRPGTPSLQA